MSLYFPTKIARYKKFFETIASDDYKWNINDTIFNIFGDRNTTKYIIDAINFLHNFPSDGIDKAMYLIPENIDPSKYLIYCVFKGNIKIVQFFLDSLKENIEFDDLYRYFLFANQYEEEIFQTFIDINELLIYYGSIESMLFSFHEIYERGQTIILDEIKYNNLIKDVNMKRGSKTLLIYACENNCTNLARVLLGMHADYNMKDDKGNTSIFYCIKNANIELVHHHFQYSINLLEENNDGTFPLDIALKSSNIELKELVCKYYFKFKANFLDDRVKMRLNTYFLRESDTIKAEIIRMSLKYESHQFAKYFLEMVEDKFIDKYNLMAIAYSEIVTPNVFSPCKYSLMLNMVYKRSTDKSKLVELVIKRKDVEFFELIASQQLGRSMNFPLSDGRTPKEVLIELAPTDKRYQEMLDYITKIYKVRIPNWGLLAPNVQNMYFKILSLHKFRNIPKEKLLVYQFFQSIFLSNKARVLEFIENGMDVNVVMDGIHPLMMCNNVFMASFLIEQGSKLDYKICLNINPAEFRQINAFYDAKFYNSDIMYHTWYCPIHAIVFTGRLEVLEYCVSTGINLKLLDSQENSLMHYAVSISDEVDPNASKARYLYKKKVSIKSKNLDGYQPIHYAVTWNYGAVKFLIEKRVDLNAIGVDKRIPLHFAIAHGTPEIVNLLMSKKINYDIQDHLLDYPINMIMNQKFDNNIIRIIEVYAKYGASLDYPSFSDGGPILFDFLNKHEVLKCLIDNGADLNNLNKNRDTALAVCLNNKNFVGVKMLLEGGADINASNHDTKSNLYECRYALLMKYILKFHPTLYLDAPKYYIQIRFLDVAKELILHYPMEDHYLMFNAAISIGPYEMVEYMIDNGFDINSRSIEMKTPIFDAIALNQFDILQLLIKSGANLELTNIYGETALMFALSVLSRDKLQAHLFQPTTITNIFDCISHLIDSNANIHAININGNDIFKNALLNGNMYFKRGRKYASLSGKINFDDLETLRKRARESGETLFTFIVKHDEEVFINFFVSVIGNDQRFPDTNQANKFGETPIMCVIKYNKNAAILVLLLKGGADADQEYQGKTPLQICIENEYTDKIRAFLQNECCDLNKKFDNEMSYFHLAIKMNKKLSMRALASYVFPDFVDKDGNSYLHYAALSNDREITYICLHVQEKYIVYNNENMSPLMLASSINSFRYIDQFIDFCDKHWIPIKDKYRSLFLSAIHHNPESFNSIMTIIQREITSRT